MRLLHVLLNTVCCDESTVMQHSLANGAHVNEMVALHAAGEVADSTELCGSCLLRGIMFCLRPLPGLMLTCPRHMLSRWHLRLLARAAPVHGLWKCTICCTCCMTVWVQTTCATVQGPGLALGTLSVSSCSKLWHTALSRPAGQPVLVCFCPVARQGPNCCTHAVSSCMAAWVCVIGWSRDAGEWLPVPMHP